MALRLLYCPTVIDRPCTTCGYSLEKGTKIVAIADVISGCVLVPLWSVLLKILFDNPPKDKPITDETKNKQLVQHENEMALVYYDLEISLLCSLIAFAVIQILLGFLLYYGQANRNIPIIYLWLVISGFSILANGFFIKIYEMIVVQAYSDELKCMGRAEALEKFRELPYICVMKIQLYPGQTWGWGQNPRDSRNESERKSSMAYYERKSYIINGPQNKAFDPIGYQTTAF